MLSFEVTESLFQLENLEIQIVWQLIPWYSYVLRPRSIHTVLNPVQATDICMSNSDCQASGHGFRLKPHHHSYRRQSSFNAFDPNCLQRSGVFDVDNRVRRE